MNLPFLTADLPGTGGTLRTTDDDFVVDEEPAYAPSGTGDHVFVRIEKRGLTTAQATGAIARALRVAERDLGVAGMKDRHAVTTQWLSLPPPVTPEAALALNLEGIRFLEAVRHGHKLRTGHVKANRFRLRVRGVGLDAAERARAILDRLAEPPGAPNWFGEQRFGRSGDNAIRGRELVTTEKPPGRGRDRRFDRLLVSALQSELFNTWLVARLADGLYRKAIAGDILHKRSGGMFACEDAEVETARVLTGEVVPTGPMFGDRMRQPGEGTLEAEREAVILDAAGLTRESFARVRSIAEGTRRDAAIAVADIAVTTVDDSTIEVAFTLPGGAYATAVMRELTKADSSPIRHAEE